MSRRPPILIAMSGGVDSSVAAAMMVQRGYDVIGVTLQIWQESQTDPRHAGCCSLGAVEDARRVARLLGIPHYVVNFKDEFRETVIQNFIDEYSAGRTPNPCVQCNRKVKFDELIHKMREFGCERLVTGHYARIRRRNGQFHLMRARGSEKDQSYVLYMLRQDQLAVTGFPLGELKDKSVTRSIARDLGLPIAEKPDSQEICFVSEAGGYREFLRKVKPEAFSEGEIVDEAGKILTGHGGIADFTVGQRKGIGLTVPSGKPLFVLKIHPESNQVVVGHEDALLTKQVFLEDLIWGKVKPEDTPIDVMAKIRYNMDAKPARLFGGECPRLEFKKPVRAVTPGQIAVAYVGQTVAMGGTIKGQ